MSATESNQSGDNEADLFTSTLINNANELKSNGKDNSLDNGSTSKPKEKKRKGKKSKIVLPSSKNTVTPSELPPLPIEISNTMNILSSSNPSQCPSIFSLLHPMQETSKTTTDNQAIPSIESLVNFDAVPNEKSYRSNSSIVTTEEALPFASESEMDKNDFIFEDPFEAEMEKQRKAEEAEMEKQNVETSKPKEEVHIDYSELKKNAKSKLDSLFGDVIQKKQEISKPEQKVETKIEPVSTSLPDPMKTISSENVKKIVKTKQKQKAAQFITIEEEVSIQKVAKLLGISVKECISKLSQYVDSVQNKDDFVSCEAVELVAMDYDKEVRVQNQFNMQPTNMEESSHDLPSRTPVISVMGHVDHGKTTLLDFLRKTSVAAKEQGGITQAISAFNVQLSNDQHITFIDTPGHAAFTSMRKKGANATDIVLLISAGDDGIKEQTIEVIDLIKKENLPFVVAVTKCGKKSVNKKEALKRIGNQLLDYDIVTTQYGGDVAIVGIDSITGEGMDELKNTLYEESLIRELRADRKVRLLI